MNGTSTALSSGATSCFADVAATKWKVVAAIIRAASAAATFTIAYSDGTSSSLTLVADQEHPLRCPPNLYIIGVSGTGTGATAYFNPVSFTQAPSIH